LATSTTKTDVQTGRKAFVTVRFAGDELDPQEISAILPVTPTRAHRKGEEFFAGPNAGTLRGRTGIWFLATDKLVDSDELAHHLRFVQELLCPAPNHKGRVTELRKVLERAHADAHFTCFWRGDLGETAPTIPAQFKSAIKPLAADVETDFSTTVIPAASGSQVINPPLGGSANVGNSLILQIQEAALDSHSSVTDALRRAKVACAKLRLSEFGDWIDLELEGYMDKPAESLPEYRKLHGIPKVFNPYQGWQAIMFQSSEALQNVSFAPVGMSISAIENSLRDTKAEGEFHFPCAPELQQRLMKSLNWGPSDIQIVLSTPQVQNIIDSVRNILLTWTIEMERQGVLGQGLVFNHEERKKSVIATAQTVNNINIGQVGSFVQTAENAVIQGEIDSTINLRNDVRSLTDQVEQLLPASNLSQQLQDQTHAALNELKDAVESAEPDTGRVQRGLQALRRVLAPAGEHLLRIAVDAAVTKLTGSA